jgi:uncharacterized protein (TIGR03435 family)
MIREMLDIHSNQLSGGAGWMRHDRWDVVAKTTNFAGKSDGDVYREMLRAIAVERFHLKLRREVKEIKGLALVVAHKGKLGPAIHANTGAPYHFEVKPGPSLHAQNVSMKALAKYLKWPAAREVTDKTGLPGTYDLVLKWTPLNEEQIKNSSISRDAPTIFTALREQLGLKLHGEKIQGSFYVIEQAQRPDAN